MRKILSVAVLACLTMSALAPMAAYADDDSVQVGKDTYLNAGAKLWLNTWQTNLTGTGRNWNQITEGPVVGFIPNIALRHKNLFVSGSFMVTPDYSFPRQTNFTSAGLLEQATIKGTRQEIDMNVGYYIVPQVALTIGYKGITEKFKVTSSIFGYSENSVYLNGVTFGVTGSAPIGNGWSVYGSGAGGFMTVNYGPTRSTYDDNAMYESSELGLAWHPRNSSFSTTLGYKFQLIQTTISSANSVAYSLLPRNEVTRGFMLGANYTF